MTYSPPGMHSTEEDAAPDLRCLTYKFANGNLTDNGDGTCSIADGGNLTGSNTLTIGDGSSGDVVVTLDGDTGTDGSMTWDVSEDSFNFSNVVKLLSDTFDSPPPNAPDTAGDIAFDTNIFGAGRGSVVAYDGTALTVFPGILVSDLPCDVDDRLSFQSGGTWICAADANSGGVTIADTLVAYATSANTLGGDADFYYDDVASPNVLYVPSIKTAASATPSTDFDDSDFSGTQEGQISLNCPSDNNCTLGFGVHSGADSVTTIMQLLTEADGITNTWLEEGSIYIKEQADADGDTAGYGQFWVDTATPNIPYFTDDAGTDFPLGGADQITHAQIADADQQTSFGLVIETPADADDLLFYRANEAITVTSIDCIVENATSAVVVIVECDSAGDNCGTSRMSESITCDVDGQADDGTIGNPEVVAGAWLRAQVGTVTGTPGHVAITVSGTWDD